jgi:hypothetical protein
MSQSDVSEKQPQIAQVSNAPTPNDTEKGPPAEIKSLIETALDAFNNKNFTLFNSTFAGDVVIIDGFAPHRWLGPNAQGRWWADAEIWAKDLGVLGEHISIQEIRHWQVVGNRAYAVISATLTITLQNRELITRPGILTYTLVKLGEHWKAEGHTWARLS